MNAQAAAVKILLDGLPAADRAALVARYAPKAQPPPRKALARGLTLTSAATASGYSVATIARAVAKGHLRAVRPTNGRPRILETDLAEWLEAQS